MSRVPKTNPSRHKWLIIFLTPCLLVAGGSGWLVATESGLQWLISVAERRSGGSLNVTGINGTLLESFGIQYFELRGEGWRITLRGVQLQWQPAALLFGKLQVQRLVAQQSEVLALPSDKPLVIPDSLSLPLDVSVKQMKLDSLSLYSREGATPDLVATDIVARLDSDARHVELQDFRAHLPFGDLVGTGEIAFQKPYLLKAQATLDTTMQLSGQPVHAHVVAEAGGDLQHMSVKAEGNGAGISVNGLARLEPFSAVTVNRLQLTFSGMNAKRFFEGAPPAVLSGNADLHGIPDGGLEGSLQVLNAHPAELDRKGLPLQSVSAQVRLSSSLWQMQQLDAHLMNGARITGTLSWEERNGKLNGQLNIHELDPSTIDTRLRSTILNGNIMVEGVGNDLRAKLAISDGKMDLHGELERQGARVKLTDMRLTRGDTVITGHGQLEMDRRRTFRLSCRMRKLDLSEFATIPETELNAELDLSGALLPEVEGILQINMSDSHFAKHDISGNAHLEFTGTRHSRAIAEVRLGDNQLNLSVAHGADSEHVQMVLDAPNLAQLGKGFEGQLEGNIELTGSVTEPRLLFSAKGTNLTLPDGQHASALDATGDLAFAAMQMDIGVKDYHSSGAMNMPEASVRLRGSKEHHSVQASARIAQGAESLGDLSLMATGGLSDVAQGWQSLQWRGELDELAGQGVLPFQLLAAAPLSFSKDSFHLGTAEVAIAGGHIQFTDMLWTPQRWHSTGLFSGLNVRAINLQQSKFASNAFDSIRIGGSWEATVDEHWRGELQVRRESGDWVVDGNTGLRLGLNDLLLSAKAEHDHLYARLDVGGEYLGVVNLLASVPLTHGESGWTILPDSPLAGHLRLRSDDLSWLGPMLNSNVQSGGRLNLDTELIGNFMAPRLQGVIEGDGLSFSLLDQGIRLEQAELKARFKSDGVYIDRLSLIAPYQPPKSDKLFAGYTFTDGTGKLNASGFIDLQGGRGDLEITADHVPLLQRADRWVISSGKGHARYANKTLMLDGNILVNAGMINQPVSDRPRWSEDVQVTGQDTVKRAGPPSSVDATLDLGEHFYIRASGFEGRLAGQLKVQGDPGEPLRVTGIIAAQDAIYDAYGQRLQVERGIVNFQGPLDDPGLNILALRKGLEVEAGVEVTGTVRRPEVRLVSTPNVPDGEKLSWIVLGRVPETGGVDTALLVAAAGSILGGQSSGQIGRIFGVDEISLSQEAGEDSQQINKVTVGKQLSSRTHISYEQDLGETGGIAKFTYTLSPRITIVTSTGTDDALEFFYTFRFY